jgi:hypothetical protein
MIYGSASPWAIAGLARGGWMLVDPDRATDGMVPAASGAAHAPLAWFDSLAFRVGERAGWRGYEGSLAEAVDVPAPPVGPRTRSMFRVLNGDFNLDETSLRIERGDSLRALAVEAMSGTRGVRGALGPAGRHLWGASWRWRRGRSDLEAGYTQRGSADGLVAGAGENASGENGHLSYRRVTADSRVGLVLARGYEARRSFIPGRDSDLWSRRDAQTDRATLEAETVRGPRALAFRLDGSRGRVRRDRAPLEDREAGTLWGAVRHTRPAGEGMLDLELGAGGHGSLGGWTMAPAAAYRFAAAPFAGRVAVERLVHPVWSDLAPGTAPFLQRTWIAGLEAEAGAGAGREARAALWMGRTRDRALVRRFPLEDQWLREGVGRDPGTYDFGLLLANAGWAWRHAAISGEAFALARDRSALQSKVDPGSGARAAVEWSFRAFQGDLGVTLRAELEGVGPREAEVTGERLPGVVGIGAAARLTLGQAVVAVRARNLARESQPMIWMDPATSRPARDPARPELRFSLTWRLFD